MKNVEDDNKMNGLKKIIKRLRVKVLTKNGKISEEEEIC
jgi:hypothetical protein